MLDLLPNWLFSVFLLGVIILVIAFIRDRISLSQLAIYCLILIGLTFAYIKVHPSKSNLSTTDKQLQNLLNGNNTKTP